MSTKKEEKAAFKKLKEVFPGRDVALTSFYSSWSQQQNYYATVINIGSTADRETSTANEAVELMIERDKRRMK